jgi:hypothetical protein
MCLVRLCTCGELVQYAVNGKHSLFDDRYPSQPHLDFIKQNRLYVSYDTS